MKIVRHLGFWMTLILMMAIGCSDDPRIPPSECVFDFEAESMEGIMDETEQSIRDKCFEDALTKREDIEKKLIGEWEVIGHAESWVFNSPQPCGYFVITENEIEVQYNNGVQDTTFVSNWELRTMDREDPFNHQLRFGFEANRPFIFDVFCDDYMYFDDTPLDGGFLLLEKVN